MWTTRALLVGAGRHRSTLGALALFGSFFATPELLGEEVRATATAESYATALRIRDTTTARAAGEALRAASRSLASPRCRSLLEELTDAEGRSLARVLASTSHSAQQFLSRLVYYDGSGHPACVRHPRTLAFTRPSSRAIFVCGPALQQATRAEARSALIHEMLHALGLEYEPLGRGGTIDAVMRRCKE